MRVFLYEHISGGGLLCDSDDPPSALLAEGEAMVTHLGSDLADSPGIELLHLLRDGRLGRMKIPGAEVTSIHSSREADAAFQAAVRSADATILIAPEIDGILTSRAELVEGLGGRLLSPSSAVTRLCSDKHATAERLAAAGVPVPRGRRLSPGERPPLDFPTPAVVKPVDGAGSRGVRLLAYPEALALWRGDQPHRLERFCPGSPASVAVLCGPRENVPMPACLQRLSNDGRFRYLGGALPISSQENARAQALARRAIAALAEPVVGYVGVDLVLGDSPTGSDDVVIEINPRLTTSYVGLCAAAMKMRCNLGAAMLAVAEGKPPDLTFSREPIEFYADGTYPR
jgi:hypothetical protein